MRCGNETAIAVVEGRDRPRCVACGFVHYLDPKVAVAVVIQREDHVLLGLRGPGTREPGKWSFPAGFVERGEELEAAAAREALEETGLTVRIGRLIALRSAAGEAVITAFYHGEIVDGIAAASDDLEDLGWFPVGEPPELAFPHDYEIMASIVTVD